MDYKDYINPELWPIAKMVPYNRAVVWFANYFLASSFHSTPVPEELAARRFTIRGHRGLKFNTEVYEPSNVNEKLPCLIYAHGGAFSYKASVYTKLLAYMYASKANCRVFFPDYHLAPRYPYPAAYDDILALYKYITDNSEELKIDDERIGVAGDSSGATLAALISGNYEHEALKRPCIQMLIYPLTDITMQTDSMKRFSDTPVWNSKSNRRALSYYLGKLKAEEAYGASPMHSRLPQIIPDTYVETAEYDCLHDEGILYAERLRNAGARVEINDTKGTIHGYDSDLNTEIAKSNIEKRILFLKKGFSGSSSI